MIKRAMILLFFVMLLFLWSVPAVAQSNETCPSGIPINDMEVFIDDYMIKYIGKTSPGAAVVVVKDGNIIFSKGYGYADIENQIAVDTKKTIFEFGSVSKLFIYTTIMRLKEQGLLDLTEDIRNYLPEGYLKKIKYEEPITMIDVMNHTTGFEDYLFDVVVTSNIRHTFSDTLRTCQPEQVYMPGSISAYSNYAVALAAFIAEQKTGRIYHEYLEDTYFCTLGMDKTSADPLIENNNKFTSDKAKGYYVKNGVFKNGDWSYVPLYPVGGINGTAEDLAKFAIALMPKENEKCILFNKKETLYEMFTQTHKMGKGLCGFAHGFIEWDGQYRVLGHGGNTAYFSAQLNIVPQERFGVIVLCNAAAEMDITSGLTQALLKKIDERNTIISGTDKDLKIIEGKYIPARRMHNGFLTLYGYLQVINAKTVDQDKIKLNIGNQSSTLVHTGDYKFKRVEADGAIFKYHFDEVYFDISEGRVNKMSGDYLPLTNARSSAIIYLSLATLAICLIYFFITPIILILRSIKNRKHKNCFKYIKSNTLLLLTGTLTLLNNAILIFRMILNNYRAFSEVSTHIILNYALMLTAVIFSFFSSKQILDKKIEKRHKLFTVITIIMTILLYILLTYWQFFELL